MDEYFDVLYIQKTIKFITKDELVENQDIEEMTSREYIVGYLCLKLQQEIKSE